MTASTFAEVLRDETSSLQSKHPVLAAVLSRAQALVHDGHIFMEEDGHSAHVRSGSDAAKWYHINGSGCPCDASRFEKAHPCKHRTAVRLYERVTERMALDDECYVPVDMEASPAPAIPAAPLPEAPASVNVRLTIDGRDCQLTLRDTDEVRLLQRLATVLQRYPMPQPAPPGAPAQASPQADTTPQCPAHGALKASTKAPGTFFCTRKLADGSYCPSRFPE